MGMELGSTKVGVEALPTELKEEILVRLPVKSLLRFRAFCKPWKSLIDSISFKKKHLHFVRKNRSTLLICRGVNLYRSEYRRDGDTKPTIHLLFPDTHHVSPSLDYDFIVDPTFIDEYTPLNYHPDDIPEFEKIGVANGLVLLCWNKFPVIWNPLSNDFKKIDPPPRVQAPDDCKWLTAEAFTIGFDQETLDYKILFAYFFESGERSKVTFQLYSVRSGSWKTVSVPCPLVHFLVTGDGFMDGKFYWFAMQCGGKDGSKGPGVISFDFTTEAFEVIRLPEGLVDKHGMLHKEEVVVVTTRGCLELIKTFGEVKEGRRCEIWGMTEDGSWTMKSGVSLPSGIEYPRGVSKDGQLVCESLSNDRLNNLIVRNHFDFRRDHKFDINVSEILLIDLTTGVCNNFCHGSIGFEVFSYVESLFTYN